MSTPTPEQLGSLNAPQKRAVTYGEPLPGGKGFRSGPLLIIAGAGTGKTNTLAHRVAHLAMSGVDPARILMLTFTRRAALEMKRRANEIMREAFNDKLGGKAQAISQRLMWAGTFHSIGNRLLRHYAKHVGLDPAFTVLDRSDAADLIDTVRTELGFSGKGQRFPRKDTCYGIYSYRVNTQKSLKETLESQYSWCANHEEDIARLLSGLCRTQGTVPPARLRRPAALLARDDERGPHRQVGGPALRPHPGRRVPGHQQAAGRHPARAAAGRAGRHGGRRRCAGYLLVPRRGRGEHPRLPGPLPPQGGDGHAGAELPLQPEHPGLGERADGGRAAPVPQAPAVDARPGTASQDGDRGRPADPGRIHRHARARLARGRRGAEAPGRVVPQRLAQRRARSRAAEAQDPLREIRRSQVPRGRARQGPAGHPALGGQSA